MNRKSDLVRLRAKLITLSAIKLGMSNAQSVKREYEELFLGIIDYLIDSEDTLSSSESGSTK